MKILILDSITLGDDISLDKLKELGEVITYPQSSREEAKRRITKHNPEVIITNKVVIDEAVLSGAPAVKMIAETATGYNNIDLVYAKAHGITVANVAGYSTQSVIQHTFALCFYLLEKLSYYDNYVKSGAYINSPCFTHFDAKFHELAGKTWGIIGLGAIGRGVAKIAESFGCKVIYYSASGHTYDVPYERVEFDEILAQSDILSIHAPLNQNTENLMNKAAFEKMKNSAILINVGRGPIVNDEDLVAALNENQIAAAGLDVLTKEPVEADNPLNSVKDSTKLIVTPHIAWATVEARTRLMDEVYENIKAFTEGKARNVVG
jgi:lactate dehydrogenase-like 2-hydroxyacid dehydrogenase